MKCFCHLEYKISRDRKIWVLNGEIGEIFLGNRGIIFKNSENIWECIKIIFKCFHQRALCLMKSPHCYACFYDFCVLELFPAINIYKGTFD